MKQLMTLGASLLISHAAFAQVQNGDFETWTNNQPQAWSKIDSGIEVNRSSAQLVNGSYSAAITVNTGNQGSTDFRQSINVNAGQTYNFSVSVYHTEGGIKARLYIDGYRGFTVPSQTGQWQTVSYSYTATSTKAIDVGMRFYDVSGFDGSEIVYLDNFQPTASTTPVDPKPPTPPTPPSCSATSGKFTFVTDNYPEENSWQLTRQGTVIKSGSGYGKNSTNEIELCLADGNYELTVSDVYGDGMCCNYGNGSYKLELAGKQIFSGGTFTSSKIHSFKVGGSVTPPNPPQPPKPPVLDSYYKDAEGLSGYALKTALFNIINDHTNRGYGAIWTFYKSNELDVYYEKDGSILDIYSENPTGSDSYSYTKGSDQCGNYRGEGGCYNREHSFPKSWFSKREPMHSDIHHIFATDGYVNSKRSNYPYGEVGSASYTSSNGSKLGSAKSGLGYSGTVFEPIDEFKGDVARGYLYMATRYQNRIASWENTTSNSDAILDGSSNQVFERWTLDLLLKWHAQDPVSQKEIDRNNAAHQFQGNRNPFVDYPEFAQAIWGN